MLSPVPKCEGPGNTAASRTTFGVEELVVEMESKSILDGLPRGV
jgi:hypothetical protein